MSDEPSGMEQRLMRRINDNHAAVLAKLGSLEGQIRDVSGQVTMTREMITAVPVQLANALEKALLPRLREIEARLAKLEPPE